MTKKICPVCDKTMPMNHYCSFCRSWVREPNITHVDYYLNERHSARETDCEYHGKPSAGRIEKPKVSQPNISGNKPLLPNMPRALKPDLRRPAGDRQQRQDSPPAPGMGKIIWAIFIIIFIINFLLPIFNMAA